MKNWKTTLVGFLIGGVKIGYALYRTGDLTVDNLVTSLGIALVGFMAKDFNVTGAGGKDNGKKLDTGSDQEARGITQATGGSAGQEYTQKPVSLGSEEKGETGTASPAS